MNTSVDLTLSRHTSNLRSTLTSSIIPQNQRLSLFHRKYKKSKYVSFCVYFISIVIFPLFKFSFNNLNNFTRGTNFSLSFPVGHLGTIQQLRGIYYSALSTATNVKPMKTLNKKFPLAEFSNQVP